MNDQPTPQTEQETMASSASRFVRQEDFVPNGSLEGKNIIVIGCGAIGRQVALQLAAIGVREITLCDFDTVTPTNVTTQGFNADDVGVEKVYALEKSIKAIDPEIKVNIILDRFREKHAQEGEFEVVFMCVDKIEARQEIWPWFEDAPNLCFIDTRMLGEVMRIIGVSGREAKAKYPETLFPQSQQANGRCTGHATIYTANIAGGLAVHQMTRWLRGMSLDFCMCFNLLSGDYFPASE